MKQVISVTIVCLICGVFGLAAGWLAGFERGKSAREQTQQKQTHKEQQKPTLSQKTLKNMGVEVQPAKLTSFSKYESIPALIEQLPITTQPVFAPISGTVDKIFVEENQVVEKQQVVVTLIRDAVERVDLSLTRNIIKPATEELHESLASFRRALKNLEILKQERQRLQKYAKAEAPGEYPIVPKKRLIENKYEIERAKQEVELTGDNLLRHGLSTAQLKRSEAGKLPEVTARIWNKALKRHGLWPKMAQELYQALPEKIQKLHWTVAAIGELVAGGLIKPELLQWFTNDPQAGKYFLEVASLLQRGNTLKKIRRLYERNGFEEKVEIRAPALHKDWDVAKIVVKTYQHVAAGDPLVVLKSFRHLKLLAQPEGGERPITLQALKHNRSMQAVPLLEGEGPTLENLQIGNITSNPTTGTMQAYIPITNELLQQNQDANGIVRRTWKLRPKQQYVLRVPTEVFDKVYVFPRGAITEDGAKKIVFLQSGDHFKPLEVVVLYQDHEVMVISHDSGVFPGDPIVHQGAFALSMALQAQQESGGQAGHGHGHGHGGHGHSH